MAIQGKKINELDLLQEDLTGNTVIPVVYVGNTTSSTANKVTINQISNKVQTDMSTILVNKQDKLTAGDGITISEENVISADAPNNVYTEDNLVAGSNISFTKGIKDGNTILLAPYRGTYNNQYFHSAGLDISNYNIFLPIPSTIDNEGTTFISGYSSYPQINGFNITSNNSFTFECWIKSSDFEFTIAEDGSSNYGGIFLNPNDGLLVLPSRNTYTIPDLTKYNHYALVYKNGDLSYFLNGTKLETQQTRIRGQSSVVIGTGTTDNLSVHDLRISNIDRYDADFTPTEHFEIEEATAINFGLGVSTALSSASTDSQIPTAKCVYDIVGNIESALQTIRGVQQ